MVQELYINKSIEVKKEKERKEGRKVKKEKAREGGRKGQPLNYPLECNMIDFS